MMKKGTRGESARCSIAAALFCASALIPSLVRAVRDLLRELKSGERFTRVPFPNEIGIAIFERHP